MGNGGSSVRGRSALLQLNPYIFNDGTHAPIEYNPGLPVDEYLLPPSMLLHYDSLPESVLSQINVKEDHYDLNGNQTWMTAAMEEGEISEPTGKARNDYITWLHQNPDIAQEIDDFVMDKIQQADMIRKDIAETEALEDTVKDKITERVIFENEMMKNIFKDDLKKRTAKYGIMIQNSFQGAFTEAANEFNESISQQNANSA